MGDGLDLLQVVGVIDGGVGVRSEQIVVHLIFGGRRSVFEFVGEIDLHRRSTISVGKGNLLSHINRIEFHVVWKL